MDASLNVFTWIYPEIEEIFECPPLLHIFPLIYITIYSHSFFYCIALLHQSHLLWILTRLENTSSRRVLSFHHRHSLFYRLWRDKSNPTFSHHQTSLLKQGKGQHFSDITQEGTDPTNIVENAARSKGQRRGEARDVLWYVCYRLHPGCADRIRYTIKSMVYHLSMSRNLFIHTTSST